MSTEFEVAPAILIPLVVRHLGLVGSHGRNLSVSASMESLIYWRYIQTRLLLLLLLFKQLNNIFSSYYYYSNIFSPTVNSQLALTYLRYSCSPFIHRAVTDFPNFVFTT